MKPRTYDTPAAFKRALEDRLKAASTSGVDFARRRQLLVFDRFLARMAVAFGDAVMLKGGLVLELRLERARTTKDVDLRLAGSSKDILDRLRAAGALDLGDFMQFEVAPDPDTPEIVGDGVQYDGYRFRAECRLAGKVYGARFGVDIAFGGVLSGDVEEITTDDPRVRRDRAAQVARRPDRDAPRREAARVHDAAEPAEHEGEGPAGPGAARDDPTARRHAGPGSDSADLRLAPCSPRTGAPPLAARGVDGSVRADGGARRPAVAHAPRGRGGRAGVPGSLALFATRRSVGPGFLVVDGMSRAELPGSHALCERQPQFVGI